MTATETCVHGLPLGWACASCAGTEPGTVPARRADPPMFRDSRFIGCGHDDLERAAVAAFAVRLAERVADQPCCSRAGQPGRHDPGCWSGALRWFHTLLKREVAS